MTKAKIAVDEAASAVIRADAIKNLEFILHKLDQLDKYNMLIVKGHADRPLSKDERIWSEMLTKDELIRNAGMVETTVEAVAVTSNTAQSMVSSHRAPEQLQTAASVAPAASAASPAAAAPADTARALAVFHRLPFRNSCQSFRHGPQCSLRPLRRNGPERSALR